jgi:hypothetical protein
MQSTTNKTEPLNRLIRGEMAAVDTYNQALETVMNEPFASDLHAIMVEHRTAAQVLRQHVNRQGGMPASSPGTWGGRDLALESVSPPVALAATFKVLMEGEAGGVREYEQALQERCLDPQSRSLISSVLIPRTRSHISILDRFIQGHWRLS